MTCMSRTYMSREERRALILDAAVDLIREHGLSGTTVRAVASAIQASPGQIHHHFKSVDELRAEAFRIFWQTIVLPGFNEQAEGLPILDKLRALLIGDTSEDRQHIERVWREAMAVVHQDEVVRQTIREGLQEWHQTVTAAIEEAQQIHPTNANKDSPSTIANRLIALSLGSEFLDDLHICPGETTHRARLVTWGIKQELGLPPEA